MNPQAKEFRRRSLAAEQSGDERKALCWSRREAGAEALPQRVLFDSRHGSVFKLSAQQMHENGGSPYAIRATLRAVTSRKQMARIVRNLLTPMGRAYMAPMITIAADVVHS